jgi:hypothetical protein
MRLAGNGTFGAPTQYTIGTHPVGIAAVNLVRKNFADIVATDSSNNTITVLINIGTAAP